LSSCIFCKIATGEIPAEIVWQDEHAVAFRDVQPQAPVHILIIPRRHIESFAGLGEPEVPFLQSLGRAIRELAREEGVQRSGYRILSNNGPDAGQEVLHLHCHLLGGRELGPMLLEPDQNV
jgi:histidine triad (HIT) family protein